MCMYHSFLVHLSVDGHVGRFPLLVTVTTAAMNMFEQVSLEKDVESFGYVPRSESNGGFLSSRIKVREVPMR